MAIRALVLALLGAGNDGFRWDPGDGNDTVEGQAGYDALDFNGANIGEIMEISAAGDRAHLTRNIANINMDLKGVEVILIDALGGADIIKVGNMAGTDVGRFPLTLRLPAAAAMGKSIA